VVRCAVKTTRSAFCKLYLLDTVRHEGTKDNKEPSGTIKGGEFPDLVAMFLWSIMWVAGRGLS